jgi:8-oxo-dGTP pyrophosphatase MutT (NUDIX family)
MNVRHDHVTVFVVRCTAGAHEFLQLRRSAGDYLGGTWQTVRGTSEAGETAVRTALRELREETGLAPLEFYSLGVVETFFIAGLDTIWHSPAFLALVDPGAALTLDAEHDAHRWIDATEMEQACMWASEKPLVRVVREQLLTDTPCRRHLRIHLPL